VGDPLQLAMTFGAMEMQDKDCQLFLLNLYQDRKKHVLLNLIRVISAFWCFTLEISALGLLKKIGKDLKTNSLESFSKTRQQNIWKLYSE
jgi:hypothetical protein